MHLKLAEKISIKRYKGKEDGYVYSTKKVILNEIAFWKQNKLLPEHYCDFLTALYAQGEGEGTEVINEGILAEEAKSQS